MRWSMCPSAGVVVVEVGVTHADNAQLAFDNAELLALSARGRAEVLPIVKRFNRSVERRNVSVQKGKSRFFVSVECRNQIFIEI